MPDDKFIHTSQKCSATGENTLVRDEAGSIHKRKTGEDYCSA